MKSREKTTILTIDPGYDRVGWAVGVKTGRAQVSVTEYGCIETDKRAGIFERYQQIRSELEEVITRHGCHELAIEQLFFSKNTKTALRVSEARGLIIATGLAHHLSIHEYNPGSIKLAVTGHGQATKTAVTKMVRLQLGVDTSNLLDDTVDALAILLTHAVSH